MKKILCLIIIITVVFLSCGSEEEPNLASLTANEISGARLWSRITEGSDYNSYRQWKEHEGIRPGQSPHGVWHKVFANRVIYDALPVKDSTAPYGTIIVKENYTSSKKLDKLTVMAKVKGYSPETNDWFWAVFSPEGKVLAEGSPGGCLSCHGGMKSNDYIIIKKIDEP
jgi:hypothetical protein